MTAPTSIALDQLRLSGANVRKTVTGIEDLAASIAAHGLLQNLTVTAGEGSGFDVVAGGRRLKALQQLAAAGTIKPDHLVPCIVVEQATAAETSTAENTVRQAMHPADEFEAFAALVTAGHSTHEVADRFGCEDIHVRQRMRLAAVAPAILADYRAGKATLEQLMALTVSDDQDLQLRLWKSTAKRQWEREPRRLREALTVKEYDLQQHRVALFVGEEAYVAAGGQVRRDLFGEPGAGFMTDTKLADRLAMEKLQRRADQLLKEGWLWAEPRLTFGYDDGRGFQREHGTDCKAFAGAVVSISQYGDARKMEVTTGLVRPGDRKTAAKGKNGNGKAAKAKGRDTSALPFPALQRLQGYRTAALRLEMARRPNAALAALAAQLWRPATGADQVIRIDSLSGHSWRPEKPVEEGINAAPQSQQLQAEATAFADRLAEAGCPKGDIYSWLLTQPIETTHAVLAHCVARQVVAADKYKPTGGKDAGAVFAAATGIDFGTQWRVTPEWLATIPRKATVAAVAECYGKLTVARIDKLRGPELHKQAAELLTQAGWLPPALRAPGAKPTRIPDAKPSTEAAAKPAPRKTSKASKKVGPRQAADSKAAKVKQAVKNAQASKPRKANAKAAS